MVIKDKKDKKMYKELIKLNSPLSEKEAHRILDEVLGIRFERRNELHDLIEKIYFDSNKAKDEK